MHGLDVIILGNARAEGREHAHDDADHGRGKSRAPVAWHLHETHLFIPANDGPYTCAVCNAYREGYAEGRRDDALGNGA